MALAIVDCKISEKCERSLLIKGFTVLKTTSSKKLPAPLSSHPDMLMFMHGNSIITSADYCDEAAYFFTDLHEYCPEAKLRFSDECFAEKYPRDAIFNALTVGRYIFLKEDTVSRAVIEYANEHNMEICCVRQGYPACTVLPLGEGHAITADNGMMDAMTKVGIDVTLIENGGISLPPFKYGFIGGASGVYGKTVYFLGDPKTHPSGEKILSACERAGYESVALSDEPLSDLGRIIFIEH